MTRKDFELIAQTIQAAFPGGAGTSADAAKRHIALQFAHALRCTNDRFDEERFLKACGMLVI